MEKRRSGAVAKNKLSELATRSPLPITSWAESPTEARQNRKKLYSPIPTNRGSTRVVVVVVHHHPGGTGRPLGQPLARFAAAVARPDPNTAGGYSRFWRLGDPNTAGGWPCRLPRAAGSGVRLAPAWAPRCGSCEAMF
jgi:hypothetical protein